MDRFLLILFWVNALGALYNAVYMIATQHWYLLLLIAGELVVAKYLWLELHPLLPEWAREHWKEWEESDD